MRDNYNGTIDRDADNMKRMRTSGGQVVDWTYWGSAPYFASDATIDDPVVAYKKVLSDVGANQPVADNTDLRIIGETRDRSYTYTGSLSKLKGQIDSEADCGGFEVYPEEHVDENYDADGDGIPTWFEQVKGTDPLTANNNADDDRDGYTDLEDYLNWMAEAHLSMTGGETADIDLSKLFAGFTDRPAYRFAYEGSALQLELSEGGLLHVKAAGSGMSLNTVTLTVTDAQGDSMQRLLNVAVTNDATAIATIDAERVTLASYEVYTLDGAKLQGGTCHGTVAQLPLSALPTGIYLVKGTDTLGKVRTYKIVK